MHFDNQEAYPFPLKGNRKKRQENPDLNIGKHISRPTTATSFSKTKGVEKCQSAEATSTAAT